ncbi:MAG TPA: NAD-dependent protein deacylase [Tepidiformaceae bacterium]|nr:NAD-dependent protein deacylase [Tepidiformaceae bacterium]
MDPIDTVAEWLRESSYTVALTGAGISTESGIPDFRGPQGVWTKNPEAERQATIQHYMADREARVRSWRNRNNSPLLSAEPNAGHRALVDLEHKGKLQFLITQNVDGLHLKAGSDPGRIVEVHGNVREFMCMNCTDRGPIERVLARVEAGEEDPPCRSCGGILKSRTVSFGQGLFPGDMERAEAESAKADVFLAIGTTLGVYPVAYTPAVALERGAKLVIINAEPTPYDEYASAILRDPIGQILPAIVARV